MPRCGGRGECLAGFCHCPSGYWGMDCTRSKAYALDPDNVTEVNGTMYSRCGRKGMGGDRAAVWWEGGKGGERSAEWRPRGREMLLDCLLVAALTAVGICFGGGGTQR